MSNIKKYVVLPITMILLFLVFGFITAQAYTGTARATVTPITNPSFYNFKVLNDGRLSIAQGSLIHADGILAYCLEPGVPVDQTGAYRSSSNPGTAGLTQAQWDVITRIAYYGFGYQNQTNIRWHMATQALIWEHLGLVSEVYFAPNVMGTNRYDISHERNTIMQRVNSHQTVPSFSGRTFNAFIGQTLTLTDTNNVLNRFTVTNNGGHGITRSGNNLIVNVNRLGNNQVRLINDQSGPRPNLVHVLPGSQNLMTVEGLDPVNASFNIIGIGGKVNLQKLDRDTKKPVPQGEASLAGAVYGIFRGDELITTMTTDAEGRAQSTEIPIGKYTVREITPSHGYYLDETVYEIELTAVNPVVLVTTDLNVYQQIILKRLEIIKIFAGDETGHAKPEANVKFEIFNRHNESVAIIETDRNGFASFELPFGTYTVRQISTTPNYEKVEDFTFTFDENSEYTLRFVLSNAEIRARLKLVKVDSITGETITEAGARFRIRNLDTGELVRQRVTYPTVRTIEVFETDANGIFVTPQVLSSGRYQLEEVRAPNGYLLNKEPLEFELGENATIHYDSEIGVIKRVEFANDPVKGRVKIKKEGETFTLENNQLITGSISLGNVKFKLFANGDIVGREGTVQFRDNEKVATLITDANGKVTSDKLPLGKYCLVEIETHEAYVLDTDPRCFELKYNDQYTEVVYETISMLNKLKEQPKIEMPRTGRFEFSLEIFVLVLALMGVGLIVTSKKCNKE